MADSATARVILSERFGQALAEAGIIDIFNVRRIVIDAEAGHAVRMHVEYYGDERLLQVAQALDGIEITSVPAETGGVPGSR